MDARSKLSPEPSGIDYEFREKMSKLRPSIDDLYNYKGRKIASCYFGNVYKARKKKGEDRRAYTIKEIDGENAMLVRNGQGLSKPGKVQIL